MKTQKASGRAGMMHFALGLVMFRFPAKTFMP